MISVARPSRTVDRPVETRLHLSRQARRLLGPTGAVRSTVENLEVAAGRAAVKLWDSCGDHQVVVWLDNWYRKRFGTDPSQVNMSLNVSVLAVLHIPEVPIFQGQKSLGEILASIPRIVVDLTRSLSRLLSGIKTINEEEIQAHMIRVPLDIHREGMRSLQWSPYLLTENSVSNQADLLQILHDLRDLQRHTRRPLPLLVDMDLHYRVMKFMYGVSTSEFAMSKKMSMTPVLFGV